MLKSEELKKEYITITEEQIRMGLDEFNNTTYEPVEYSDDFVKNMAKLAIEGKKDLISLLSQHPNWDKHLMCIKMPAVSTKETDWERVKNLLRLFIFKPSRSPLFIKGWGYEEDVYDLHFILSKDKEEIEDYNIRRAKAIEACFGRGFMDKKPSKKLMAFCKHFNLDKEEGFNKWYAVVADELSAKPYNFTLFISVNPAHFLTMSNPKEQKGSTMVMTSCHSLNYLEGYGGGNSGYAHDNVSIVVFTVPEGRDCLCSYKISRQLFHYENGLLLQNRLYIAKSDDSYGGVYDTNSHRAERDDYRHIMQSVISVCEDKANLWGNIPYDSNMVERSSDFGGYPDFIHFSELCKLTYNKEIVNEETVQIIKNGSTGMVIGDATICLSCGEESDSPSPYCSDCNKDGKVYCECCGEYVYEDEVRYIDGYGNVCDDCIDDAPGIIYCDYHGEYEYVDNKYERVINYGCVCDDAIVNSGAFQQCGECGEWYHCDNIGYIESVDDYVCDNCLNSNYSFCDRCEQYVPNNDIALKNDNEFVCYDCLTDEERNIENEEVA